MNNFDSLLFFSILFFIGMLAGALYYHQKLFPIPQLYRLLNPKEKPKCPVVDKKKLKELEKISESINIRKIFWGDSVVEGMHDSRFYGVKTYQEIAQSKQIVYCALKEIDYILNLKPEKVLIYLGGNDCDKKSWYGPEEAGKYFERIIDAFLANGIKPIIHLIHGSSLSRDKDYLKKYNQILEVMAKDRNLILIPPVSKFTFNKTRLEMEKTGGHLYSYDGVHLTPEGYMEWVMHIRKYLRDF